MDKVWLDNYPEQVVTEIDPDSIPSLVDLFEQSIADNARLTAFINMGQGMTYAELDSQSRAFAAYLQKGLQLDKGARVAVIGVPDTQMGEKVKLFVVCKGDRVAEESLTKHCREHLTGYKVPRLIEYRDELPKTNVGKYLRRELRDND